MELSKSKIILKKITALHESAEAFEGGMSKMERDLILHYLRELYELIAIEPLKESREEERPRTEPKPETVLPSAEPHSAKAGMAMKYIEKEQVTQPSNSGSIDQTVPAWQHQKNDSANGVTTETIAAEEKSPGAEIITENRPLKELFEEDKASLASSRFGRLPISDISKSMGINDRIQTINELFGGDQNAFNNCTAKLNALKGFEEAKRYLISGPASTYEWENPMKKTKALMFISLVRRRYL